ncbi:glutathione S-transferase family protein [Rhodoligotrophos defluvii]|uniref:glutathione S-transferase family protein n=1 Tax=Rhodoligotrophos defluvii TaxID=2561934 RepID=UPI0010CA0775|nr:glutathione S-transferase family protein [Rhodoligotrophos defluvii]
MSDEIVFYSNPRSRALIVHWMLEEVGAKYRTVTLDLQKGEQRQPDYLAINPMGKVPAIVHRGNVVTETPAIIAYLADAFPDAGLAPAVDDPARGPYYRWLFFGGSCFEPALLDKMMKRPPVEPAGMTGHGSYEDVLASLKTALTPGPYLLGERFSAADVYIGSELGWAIKFGAPGLDTEPVITDYVSRMASRPAFMRTIGQT